jgi:hypothetical protein
MQALRSWCPQKLGIGMRIQIKSTESIVFAKVDAKIRAARIPRLAVKEVEVALVVKVAETMLDILIAEVVVVVREVFGGRGGSEGSCHDWVGGAGKVGALGRWRSESGAFVQV